MKKTTLIIGAGGVGRVVVHKCVLNADIFGEIVLASRSIERCAEIKKEGKCRHSYKCSTSISRFNYYGRLYQN